MLNKITIVILLLLILLTGKTTESESTSDLEQFIGFDVGDTYEYVSTVRENFDGPLLDDNVVVRYTILQINISDSLIRFESDSFIGWSNLTHPDKPFIFTYWDIWKERIGQNGYSERLLDYDILDYNDEPSKFTFHLEFHEPPNTEMWRTFDKVTGVLLIQQATWNFIDENGIERVAFTEFKRSDIVETEDKLNIEIVNLLLPLFITTYVWRIKSQYQF